MNPAWTYINDSNTNVWLWIGYKSGSGDKSGQIKPGQSVTINTSKCLKDISFTLDNNPPGTGGTLMHHDTGLCSTGTVTINSIDGRSSSCVVQENPSIDAWYGVRSPASLPLYFYNGSRVR